MKKNLTIISGLMFLLVIIPFLVGSFFAYPATLHDWQMAVYETTSLSDFFQHIKNYSFSVGGRVVSEAFFLSIFHWFSLQNYAIVACVAIIIHVIILYSFFREVFVKEASVISGLVSILFCTLFFIEQENVYEQNYVLSVIFTYHNSWFFFLLGFLSMIKYMRTKANIYFYLFHILMVLATLSLEIWFLLSFPLFITLYSSKRWKVVGTAEVIALSMSIMLMSVSFLAPGNFNRSAGIQESITVVEKLAYTAASIGWLTKEWVTSPGLYLYTLLLFILGTHSVNKLFVSFETAKSMLFLGIATIGLVNVLLVFGNQGTTFPERLANVLFLYFLVLWSIFIWTFAQHSQLKPALKILYIIIPLYFVVAFFGGLSMDRDIIKESVGYESKAKNGISWKNNNISNMYKEWLSGEWGEFKQEQNEIFELLKESQKDTLFIKRKDYPISVYDDIFDLRNREGRGDKYTPIYFGSKSQVISFEPKKDN